MPLHENLNDHEQRRRQGIATLSVLVGDMLAAEDAWRAWCRLRGKLVVPLSTVGREAILDQWLTVLDSAVDPRRLARQEMAKRTGRSPQEIRLSLEDLPPDRRAAWLEQVFPAHSEGGGEGLCVALLSEPSVEPTAASLLDAATDWPAVGEEPYQGVLSAFMEFCPDEAPCLWAASRKETGTSTMEVIPRVAHFLANLALAVPKLPIAWGIEPELFEEYDRNSPRSRVKSLCLEGVCEVDEARPERLPDAESESTAAGVSSVVPPAERAVAGEGNEVQAESPDVCASVDWLVASGASRRLVDAYRHARQIYRQADGATRTEQDEARSLVERWLFDYLQSLPETAGVFELNGLLPIRFGRRDTMEVDLLGRSLGLAVEIDGYYHFRSKETYRRDRRKDYLLQTEGFLVLRLHAEDVFSSLKSVSEAVMEAVRYCRNPDGASQ